jgi:hypothetical protein
LAAGSSSQALGCGNNSATITLQPASGYACCPGCSVPVSKTLSLTLPNGHVITMTWKATTPVPSWDGTDFMNSPSPCDPADPLGTTYGWDWFGLSDQTSNPYPGDVAWPSDSLGPGLCACPDNPLPTSLCKAYPGSGGANMTWNGGAQSCPTLAGGKLTDSGGMTNNPQYVGNWSITE